MAFFFLVACQFVMLEAEFLAAIQVLVYIGAVAIILMFGIMLTRNVQGDETTAVTMDWFWISRRLVVALALALVRAGSSGSRGTTASRPRNGPLVGRLRETPAG